MKEKNTSLISALDPSGLFLSLSAIVLGVFLAVSDYHVAWEPAVSLLMTAVFIHAYMRIGGRLTLALSVVGAVLTAFLSFGRILSLESLLLLLFSYFVIRMARGVKDSGRIGESVITCILNGPVALFGAYFVCTHSFGFWLLMFPAMSLGLLCTAVNGLEDGFGRNVVSCMTVLGLMLMIAFSFMRIFSPAHFLYVIVIPAFIIILVRMYMKKEQDPSTYRPALALCTFVLAVLAGIGFVGYLF